MVERIRFHPDPIRKKKEPWGIVGKTFEDYMVEFSIVDKESVIMPFLESLKRGKAPVVIDLLSYPDAIRSLKTGIYADQKIRALSVGWGDNRFPLRRFFDKNLGLTHIKGDLNEGKTWRRIDTWLGNRKADFIMERGFAGLDYISRRPSYSQIVVEKLWSMLASPGILVVQTLPLEVWKEYQPLIPKWLRILRKNRVYFQYERMNKTRDFDRPYNLLLLRKDRNNQALPSV